MDTNLLRLSLVFAVLTGFTVFSTAAAPSHPLSQIDPIDEDLDMSGGPSGPYNITGVPGIDPAGNQLSVNGQLSVQSTITASGGIDVAGNDISNFFGSNCGPNEAVAQINADGSYQCANVSSITSDQYVDEAGDTMSGDLGLSNGATVTGLPDPSVGTDAVSQQYAGTTYLDRDGTDTMNGNLDLDTNNIINVGTINGVDIDTTGNALTIDGNNRYAVASNSIDSNELASNSVGSDQLTNAYSSGSAYDSRFYTQGEASNTFLNRDGTDTMNGNLDLDTNNIINVGTINGVDIDTTGNALTIDGNNRYAVASNSIDSNELASNSVGSDQLTNAYSSGSAYDSRFYTQGEASNTFLNRDGTDTMNGNLDLDGNSMINGAVCPQGSCNLNGYQTFTGNGIGTTSIYDGSGGEIDFQSNIELNSNNIDDNDNIVNFDSGSIDIKTGGTSEGITFNGNSALTGTTGNGWLRLNQDSDFSNGIYTPGEFRADGGMELRGNLDMRNNEIQNAELTGSVQLPTGNDQY